MNGKRILITGAGGFVGRALARGFAQQGWRVAALDKAFDADDDWEGITLITADLMDGMPPEVPEADVVVHSAWITTDPETLGITPAEYVARNTRPLLEVLAHAARTGPGVFVFISSSGVFDSTDGTDGLTDSLHPTGTSTYAAAKQAAELLVGVALDSEDLRARTAVHIVRLGYLFGPDERVRDTRTRVSLVSQWLDSARTGRPVEVRSDDPLRDWTFAPDLAAALARLVDGHPAGHPVHLGSGHAIPDSAMAALIASQFPEAETTSMPASGRVKPPMVPSDIAALRDFEWTNPTAGVRTVTSGGTVE